MRDMNFKELLDDVSSGRKKSLASKYLAFLDDREWNGFGYSIDLSYNSLHKLSSEQWESLGAALTKIETLTTIYLAGNLLNKLTPVQWKALGAALAQIETLTTIYLAANLLNTLTPVQWKVLGAALAQSKILTTIYLTSNPLYLLSSEQWESLGAAFAQIETLTTISLSLNGLHLLKPEKCEALGVALAQIETFTTIYLSGNCLDEMSPKDWRAFCELLAKNKTLTTIDLRGNFLEENHYKTLFKTLNENKNHTIDTIITGDEKYDKLFGERNRGKFLNIALILGHVKESSKIHLPVDVIPNILAYMTTDTKVADAFRELIKEGGLKRLHFYLYHAIKDKKPCMTVRMVQDWIELAKQEKFSVINVFSIDLSAEKCVNLLRKMVDDKKWDNHQLSFFQPNEKIMELRKCLNNKNLNAIGKLRDVRNFFIDDSSSFLRKIFKEMGKILKIEDEEVTKLCRHISRILDTAIDYYNFEEEENKIKVLNSAQLKQ
ncbi:MAG: hypothetical protein ACNA7Y_00545 [Gammaproteobacteria bacterium]